MIVLADPNDSDLTRTVSILDEPPLSVTLSSGLIAAEAASVCGRVYRSAGEVLDAIAPMLLRAGGCDGFDGVGDGDGDGVADSGDGAAIRRADDAIPRRCPRFTSWDDP